MNQHRSLRILGAMLLGFPGSALGLELAEFSGFAPASLWALALAAIGVAVGYSLGPSFLAGPWRWVRYQVRDIPPHALVAGTVGLIVSPVVAALLAVPFSALPGPAGAILPVLASVILVWTGVAIMVVRGREILASLSSLLTTGGQRRVPGTDAGVLLDTSVIIDGRVADVAKTGFIQGRLIVPTFVVEELRHIADSSDPLWRGHGRRGLEVLARLQEESIVPVQLTDIMPDTGGVSRDVDAALVAAARALECSLLTNDFNLARIAALQGVRVPNIHRLANAVEVDVLPGEEMTVRITQEGREPDQGIAFQGDGAVVVVEEARRLLNHELQLSVTRVLQTAAGRMIFAQRKSP